MEARVIDLKSKELQNTQQVVGSSNLSSMQLLFLVAQYRLPYSHSWLLNLDIIFTFLSCCRLHVMIMILLISVHWLLYVILIASISCFTDILIFLGNRLRGASSSGTDRIWILCPLWRGCWIAILKTFFTDLCWLVVSLSFFVGLGALDTFLWFGIRLSFQLWLFFTDSSSVCRNYLSASPLSFLLLLKLNL